MAADAYGPMMGKISLQPMQLVAGCIHVLRHAGYVKSGKKSAKTVAMFRLNSGLGAGLRKAFQPLVPIAPNHSYSVWLHYTPVNGSVGDVGNERSIRRKRR
jgi:hypothetical protein